MTCRMVFRGFLMFLFLSFFFFFFLKLFEVLNLGVRWDF